MRALLTQYRLVVPVLAAIAANAVVGFALDAPVSFLTALGALPRFWNISCVQIIGDIDNDMSIRLAFRSQCAESN
jgi:hypothetical protein